MVIVRVRAFGCFNRSTHSLACLVKCTPFAHASSSIVNSLGLCVPLKTTPTLAKQPRQFFSIFHLLVVSSTPVCIKSCVCDPAAAGYLACTGNLVCVLAADAWGLPAILCMAANHPFLITLKAYIGNPTDALQTLCKRSANALRTVQTLFTGTATQCFLRTVMLGLRSCFKNCKP